MDAIKLSASEHTLHTLYIDVTLATPLRFRPLVVAKGKLFSPLRLNIVVKKESKLIHLITPLKKKIKKKWFELKSKIAEN